MNRNPEDGQVLDQPFKGTRKFMSMTMSWKKREVLCRELLARKVLY